MRIYSASKITKELGKTGKRVLKSPKRYMREMGIKARYIKPFTTTTIDPDFDNNLKNLLKEQFNPKNLTPFGAQISLTTPEQAVYIKELEVRGSLFLMGY